MNQDDANFQRDGNDFIRKLQGNNDWRTEDEKRDQEKLAARIRASGGPKIPEPPPVILILAFLLLLLVCAWVAIVAGFLFPVQLPPIP